MPLVRLSEYSKYMRVCGEVLLNKKTKFSHRLLGLCVSLISHQKGMVHIPGEIQATGLV
jgi:hypothetical protein